MNAEVKPASVPRPVSQPPAPPGSPQGPEWYSRATIDEFLAAAEVQRADLQARIADANARAERARAATGLHRLMATMLLDTQRELTLIRRSAEAKAAELMAVPAPPPVGAPAPQPVAAPPMQPDADSDVVVGEALEIEAPPPSLDAPPVRTNGEGESSKADEDFIAFLRAGLGEAKPAGADDGEES